MEEHFWQVKLEINKINKKMLFLYFARKPKIKYKIFHTSKTQTPNIEQLINVEIEKIVSFL